MAKVVIGLLFVCALGCSTTHENGAWELNVPPEASVVATYAFDLEYKVSEYVHRTDASRWHILVERSGPMLRIGNLHQPLSEALHRQPAHASSYSTQVRQALNDWLAAHKVTLLNVSVEENFVHQYHAGAGTYRNQDAQIPITLLATIREQ